VTVRIIVHSGSSDRVSVDQVADWVERLTSFLGRLLSFFISLGVIERSERHIWEPLKIALSLLLCHFGVAELVSLLLDSVAFPVILDGIGVVSKRSLKIWVSIDVALDLTSRDLFSESVLLLGHFPVLLSIVWILGTYILEIGSLIEPISVNFPHHLLSILALDLLHLATWW